MKVFTFVVLLIGLTQTAFAASDEEQARNALKFRLKASVVKVHVATKSGGHGVGSGVAISEDLVATNCHVLANSVGVKITRYGGGLIPVALKADWQHDLCILRFKYAQLTPVALGDSENLAYEQDIFSIGFPGGPPKPQYTTGQIKALYPFEDSVIIRTDASFVMGASGSPVFDHEGKLLAISTFKSPGKKAYYYNIPVKWVKALLEQPDITSMETDVLPFWDAPEEKRPFFMRVVLPHKNKQWEDLQQVANDWMKAEPNTAEAWYYAGVAAQHLGKTKAAKTYFEKAMSIQNGHPASMHALSCIDKPASECESQF